MKIIAIIVTCNRLELLPRALKSVKGQSRKPDFVYIISNSTNENFLIEQKICSDFGFQILKNQRTKNNAGALNTAIEEIVKCVGVEDDIYSAFLDDDDEWLPDFLETVEINNINYYDFITAELTRDNGTFRNHQKLPTTLSTETFLKGNPGIGNSNLIIKLSFLLKAGCFDEACLSNIDRDLCIRIFHLNPKYKIIHKLFVIAHTDRNRYRITLDSSIRVNSFQYFYYKYSNFMSYEIKQEYFDWANKLFNIKQSEIEVKENIKPHFYKNDICFNQKDNSYQLVIGFIAGNDKIAMRVVKQIIKKIPADLIIIIDDAPKSENLEGTYQLLSENNISFKIVRYKEWNVNLANGYYGKYFEKFDDINSIPLGRTILHRHLFDETTNFDKPVFWIIDDDIDLNAISTNDTSFQLFDLINENMNKIDAIIGGISNDPPIPALSCIRTQLVDFCYSYGNNTNSDFKNICQKPDYYYDLSDLHSDHLETPILKSGITENHLHQIFSGKAVFRPALQRELKPENKTITRRGANTIVLNRDILSLYPVINLEVNDKFARRGDLSWALFNQVVSNKKIIEHTFCVNHNRPPIKFCLNKELEKSAYDIIGYAFNKAIFHVINNIKKNSQEDVFTELLKDNNFNEMKRIYFFYLKRRKTRFIMNYYRIIGLIKIISDNFRIGYEYFEMFKDEANISLFESMMKNVVSEEHLRKFLKELKIIILENKNLLQENELYSFNTYEA
jgi:hypothetical protein